MKYTLNLAPVDGGAFNCRPFQTIEMEAECILCNDIRFPWEHHPYNVRCFVIGNEYGALCAVWADCLREAMDVAMDASLLDSLLVSAEDLAGMSEEEKEDLTPLGNAGEYCDLGNVWSQTVEFDKARDFDLIIALAEARGACQDTLDK